MTKSSMATGANPEQLLLLAAHMARDIPGDRQVLDDALLMQAVDGERRLSRAEYAALVGSPITLCRLRFLESQRVARPQAGADADANGQKPAGLTVSRSVLKAASDLGTDCSLTSDDGLWTLHALTTGQTTRLLLQLRQPDDEDERQGLRFDPAQEWAVLDGSGGTLMLGRLDEDGELEAVWTRPLDLRSHLAQHRGKWSVEPA